MPTTVSLLTSGNSTTDGTSFTTASVSPATTSRVLVFVSAAGINSGTVTVSGLGGEWTNHGQFSNGTNKGILYSCQPATTGAVAINASVTLTGCCWQVLEATGISGTPPNVIGPYTSTQFGTSGSVSLNAGATGSRPAAGFFFAPTKGEITVTSLASGGSTADNTVFNTASVSPTGGCLLAVGVTHTATGGTTATVSGLGLTWTMQHRITVSGSTKLEVWTAPCGTSPGSGTITITGAATITSLVWHVHQVEAQHGTTPVVAANTLSNTGTGTISQLLQTPPVSDNALLFYCGAAANITQTPFTGWTELADNSSSTPSVSIESQWRRGPTTQSAPTRIKPNNVTQNDMDTAISTAWSSFKTNYLDQNVTNSWYAIDYDPSAGATAVHYVPEMQGYGLVLCASLAPIDVNAQTYFNGILKFCLDKASTIETRFMGGEYDANWALVGNQDSATDGDLDIALGCILAHKRWGTGTTVNGQTYQHWARERIAGLKASGFSPTNSLLRLGDWSNGTYEEVSRPSDWMIGHFEQFYNFTADPFWLTEIDDHLDAYEDFVTDHSSTTGLISDFVKGATKLTLSPGPADILEGPTDDDYYYNSCRVPWRMAAANESRAITRAIALSEWAATKCSGNASALPTGYTMNGTTLSGGGYQDPAFIAPFMVAATVDNNQAWLNSCWSYVSANASLGNSFADVLSLFAMIQVSQTYWYRYTGEIASSTLSGSAQWATAGLELAAVDLANTATPRSLWTELGEQTHKLPQAAMQSQWRSDAFETTASVTTTNNYNTLVVAVELAEPTTSHNANATEAAATGAGQGAVGKVEPGSSAVATASGSANNATVVTGGFTSVSPGVASALAVAEAPSAVIDQPHIVLAEAVSPNPSVAPEVGVATATSVAPSATGSVSVYPSCAESSVTAGQPHVNGPFSINAGSTASGVGPGMSIKVKAGQA